MVTVVHLQVGRLDLRDPRVVEKLASFGNATFSTTNGISLMTVYVDATESVVETSVDAARKLANLTGIPTARVYPDLVSASSIAERVGVSREAVRGWANGSRNPFPQPFGVVGEGMRVWRWIEVLEWLREFRSYDSGERLPASTDIAHIDACLSKVPDATTIEWASLAAEGTKMKLPVAKEASPAAAVHILCGASLTHATRNPRDLA